MHPAELQSVKVLRHAIRTYYLWAWSLLFFLLADYERVFMHFRFFFRFNNPPRHVGCIELRGVCFILIDTFFVFFLTYNEITNNANYSSLYLFSFIVKCLIIFDSLCLNHKQSISYICGISYSRHDWSFCNVNYVKTLIL